MSTTVLLTAVGVAVIVGALMAGFFNKRKDQLTADLTELLKVRDIQIADLKEADRLKEARITALESNVWGKFSSRIVEAITAHDETILTHLDSQLDKRFAQLERTLNDR